MTGEEEAEAVGWSDLDNFLFLLSLFFFIANITLPFKSALPGKD